jgi:hypothetical protein
VLREGVFDAGRNLRVHDPIYNAVPLEFAEMLGEHLFRCARNQPLKLAKAAGSILQIKEDEGLPLATDDFGGELDRAIETFHRILPRIPGEKKVPTTLAETLA